MNAIFIALVNGFVPGVLLGAAVWLTLRLTRGVLNAATRHGVWWVTLAIATMLPVLYLPRAPRPQEAPLRVPANSYPAPRSIAPTPAYSRVLPTRPAMAPIAIPKTRWPQILAQIWAVAALLMLARLILSLMLLNLRLRKAAAAPPSLEALMRQCLRRCGVTRQARIVIADRGASPMVAGPFRPAILMPARLLSLLTEAECEQICLHEAAHLARFDDFTLLFQRTIEALFALHPVVRWIGRQIDLEREIACDDFVIAATAGTSAYASCLTHVAELANGYPGSPVAAAAADESSHLHKRIDMLLSKTRCTGTKILKTRFVLAAAALALLAWTVARSPSLLALAAPPPQQPVSRSPETPAPQPPPAQPPKAAAAAASARALRIPVTVTDPLNRYVTGLDKNSFRLFEDGSEQAIQSLEGPDGNASFAVVSNSEGDVKAIGQTIAQTEEKLSELRNTYKDSYPEIEVLKARLEQLGREKESTAATLEARVETIEREMSRLENDKVSLQANLSYLKSELDMLDHMPVSALGTIANPPPVTRNQIEAGIAKTNALLIDNQRDLDARRKDIDWLNQELGSMPTRPPEAKPSPLLSQLTAAIDAAPANKTERAIVVVFDTRDNSAFGPENQLHALIQRSAVPVYAIAVQTTREPPASESTAFLDLLSNATGGREFKAVAWSEVPDIERKIGIEIQNEYIVTFIPKTRAPAGAYRHVEVRMTAPRGVPALQAHTIPGYYATSP